MSVIQVDLFFLDGLVVTKFLLYGSISNRNIRKALSPPLMLNLGAGSSGFREQRRVFNLCGCAMGRSIRIGPQAFLDKLAEGWAYGTVST